MDKKTIEIGDDLTIEIKWEYDEDPDVSYLGKAYWRPQPGAIPHQPDHRNTYWFVPQMSFRDHYDEYVSRLGYEPKQARKLSSSHVKEDFDRWVDYCRGGWSMMGCVAKVKDGHRVLGVSSLWNIESDSGQEYFDMIEKEQAVEALHDAAKYLPRETETMIENFKYAAEGYYE